MKVDLTGLMQKPQPGWEKRVERLCRIEYVACSIEFEVIVKHTLTKDELSRMLPKIRMVEEFAKYMTLGMLKGTIKYDHDNYPINQWLAHVIGEGADLANYAILLLDSWRNPNETK